MRAHDEGEAAKLLRGVRAMKESVTYQATLVEGAVQEAKKILFLQGSERFGPPDRSTSAALEAINDVELLERLTVQLLRVSSWQELLSGVPSRGRTGGRKKRP